MVERFLDIIVKMGRSELTRRDSALMGIEAISVK